MPITDQDVKKSLRLYPDIDAVYITSPNYEGLCANYEQIKSACEDRLLIVDEAHGAHFYFNKKMPPGAITSGVDVVTNSVHKSLGGLNGTALIHVGKQSRIPA